MFDRKVILYIACSLDGYIAKPNDDLSFLDSVQKDGEDYGYNSFIQNIDTVILGRKTYDWVMKQVSEFPHADKTTYVITKTPKAPIGKTSFYTGNVSDLIVKLKNEPGKHIFIDGGAAIVNLLLRSGSIDELIISMIPVLLGSGTGLFEDGRPEQGLKLISAKSYDSGLVQLYYKKN
jgi:dihydrofolate reductase